MNMPSSPPNFCFPIRRLENSRLILEPFDLSSHAEPFFQGTKDNPEHFAHVRYGPFSSTADFEDYYRSRVLNNPAETSFAIFAKANGDPPDHHGTFAGLIGLENADPANASIEIGFVNVITAFRRTFVASNAIGLLLLYALDAPPHGLGLRRCTWQTHALNEASRRAATRMGFTFEGVQRFQRVLPPGKVGNGCDVARLPPVAGGQACPSRDSAVFGHYCDEWAEKREAVVTVMERR